MQRFQGFMRFNLILRLLCIDCDLKIGFDEEWWGMAFYVCGTCYWTCSGVGSGRVRVFLGRHSCYWKCQEVQSSPVHVCNVWAESFFSFLIFRSLEACSSLCLHCGYQAAFWNQSELRIKLLMCVEFGVYDEMSWIPPVLSYFLIVESLQQLQGFMRFNLIVRLPWSECNVKIGLDEEWLCMEFCACVAWYCTCPGMESVLVRIFLEGICALLEISGSSVQSISSIFFSFFND